MRKIIFLDIDGVLNHEEFYKRYSPTDRLAFEEGNGDEWGDMFCPVSTKLLNTLIVSCNASIVVSSSKRHIMGDLAYMNGMWKNRGFVGEIIGITPHLCFEKSGLLYSSSVPRGCEIDKWLKDNDFSHINWSEERQQEYINKSGIDNYIIIDDDSDMLYTQRNQFVHVLPSPRNTSGFNEKYLEQAIEKLSKTVIELNY